MPTDASRTLYVRFAHLLHWGMANEIAPVELFKLSVRGWNALAMNEGRKLERIHREAIDLIGDDEPDWDLIDGGHFAAVRMWNKAFHNFIYSHDRPFLLGEHGTIYNPELFKHTGKKAAPRKKVAK